MKEERDFIIASSFSPYLPSPQMGEGRGERNLDWNYILKESIRHGVAPLIYENLSRGFHEKEIGLISGEALQSFKSVYHGTAYKNMVLLKEAKEVINALNERDIRAVPLKGASLTERFYSSIALRPMEDIDLLIRKNDLPGARMVLEDLGFRSPPSLLPDSFYLKNHFNIPFVRDGSVKTYLEIHWDFTDRYMLYTPDMESVWRESSTNLSIEDELIYLMMHIEMHGYLNKAFIKYGDGKVEDFIFDPISGNRLIWFVDLWLIINTYRDKLNWDKILHKSSEWGTDGTVLSVLSILRSLVPEIGFIPTLALPLREGMKGRGEIIYKLITSKRGSKFFMPLLKKSPTAQFRPIRLLSILRYYFPPSDYIRRYYRVMHKASLSLYGPYHLLRSLYRDVSESALLTFYLLRRNLWARFIQPVLNRRVVSLLFGLLEKKRIAYLLTPERNVPLEIADTKIKRHIGLSFRKTLKNTKGMIFIFPEERRYPFQTENMRFPIDILYLDSSMKVVSIYQDIKPSRNPIVPSRNGRYVLELPSGAARDYGITSGSQLMIQLV